MKIESKKDVFVHIIQPILGKNEYIANYNSNNNIKNNINERKPFSFNTDFSKATAENYKANYMINFKGGMNYEKSDTSGIGTLNHQTAFFREPKTDEVVQDYIFKNFGDERKINIVSGACSTGEEAKSYAMLLDNLGDKLNIMGFDISSECIEKAQNNSCQLMKNDDNYSTSFLSLDSENILLTDNIDGLTEYEKRCREKFKQYYQPKGSPYKVPVYPNAKQELEKLEASLSNKEELEKQKNQYNEQIQITKNIMPELADFSISFEEVMDNIKGVLEQNAKAYRTVVDLETEEHAFDNCTFGVGDVMNLEHMYEPGSINVLLYKNALYHTLCKGDDMFRYMKDNAPEIMDSIAKQMNKILKPEGLVVFGEEEYMQGINTDIIKRIMENNGFKQLQQNNRNANNIWVKTEDI